MVDILVELAANRRIYIIYTMNSGSGRVLLRQFEI